MADWYVRSGATGTGTGANWANAKTTFAAAISAAAAGDRYLLSDDHNESTAAALTLSFKGSQSAPDRVLCVNHLGSVPPVAADLRTTAAVATTGASALNINGNVYFYGVNWTCASGTSGANLTTGSDGASQFYESCNFILGGTGSGNSYQLASGRSYHRYLNCTFKFGAVGQSFQINGYVEIIGPNSVSLIAGTTIPTNLFQFLSVRSGTVLVGVDLTAMGSGKTLVGFGPGGNRPPMRVINCKLNAAMTISGGYSGYWGIPVQILGSDSGGNVLRNEIYDASATLTTETTIIRAGGAAFPDGTGYSWKIVGVSTNRQDFPHEAFEGVLWNGAIGSPKTLTVHVLTDNVTLTNADIWVDVDYLGTSGSSQSSRVSSAPGTALTASANLASDSGASWTTTGLTTPLKQEITITFTPQVVGWVRWRLKFAKASSTVYVCPKAELS